MAAKEGLGYHAFDSRPSTALVWDIPLPYGVLEMCEVVTGTRNAIDI